MRTRSILLAGGAFATVTGLVLLGREATAPAVVTPPVATATRPPPRPLLSPRVSAALDKLGSTNDADLKQATHESLVAALREDPAATLAALEEFLETADPKQSSAQVAMGALVAVGTPEIQRVLIGLVETRDGDDAFLRMAVPTIAYLRAPERATEEAIRALSRDGSERARTSAHLSLGVMAARISRNDTARGAAIVDDYAARLASARTDEDRKLWLLVLGNARTDAAAVAISTQLAVSDPVVRSRAVEALRLAPAADGKLAHALDDGDARVRASAAWSIKYRKPTPELLDAMLAKLPVEADAKVAVTLLEAIWMQRGQDYDRVVLAVEGLASGHASPTVRERARKLLTPT
jgi:hypothetical protein